MKNQPHLVYATQVAKDAGIQGDILATRVYGRRFFAQFKAILENAAPSTVLDLSFTDVKFMEVSFADEVFGTISAARARRELEVCPFFLSGLSDSHQDNVAYALQTRPDREENVRNCVLPIATASGGLKLIGKFEEHVQETFNLLGAVRELNARQVAETMRLSIPAASTRLKAIYNLGLALRHEVRDEEGKQYIYRWIR